MHPEASEQDKPAEDGLQQQGAAGPAPGEQQEAGAQAKGVPPIPSCYRELPQVPDAPYRLLHSLSNAHGGQAVNSVRFDPTGRRLASGGSDGTAAIWDPQSGVLLHRLKGHTAGISDVAWSHDSRYVATASNDKTLRIWDAETGACLRLLKDGHTHWVSCCAFSAGANLLVSGGFDEVLIVWDVRNARPVKIIPGHCDPVSGVHFSGEPGLHELIASCSFDGLTRVWHTATGRCQASLTDQGHTALGSVRFTPNGQFLLTATLDSRLLLWYPQERKVKRTYRGHVNNHYACQACFVVHSPDPKQRFVACGSEDHHVYLWGLSSREVVGVLRGRPSADAPGAGHCDVVLSVDASMAPDLPFIASCAHQGDGSIQVWAHESWAAGEAGAGGAAAMDTS